MRRRVLGPSLGFRHKVAPVPVPGPGPDGPPKRADQVASVSRINADDSVLFSVPLCDIATTIPLVEITVVYASTAPPADAGQDWFLDSAKAFPTGVSAVGPGFAGELTVPVDGVPFGISFVQTIFGYDEDQ